LNFSPSFSLILILISLYDNSFFVPLHESRKSVFFAIIVVQSFDCYTRISFGKTFYDKSFSCFSKSFFRVLDLLCFSYSVFNVPVRDFTPEPFGIAAELLGVLAVACSSLNLLRRLTAEQHTRYLMYIIHPVKAFMYI